MVREIICPGCGTILPIDYPPASPDPGSPSHVHHTAEILIPATVSIADISLDEIRMIAAPDPILGGFVAEVGQPEGSGATSPFCWSADSGAADRLSAQGIASNQAVPPSPAADPLAPTEDFPRLDLTPPATAPDSASTRNDEADEEEPSGRGMPLWVLLLASYASAMTLACAYLLWVAPRRARVAETLPADSRPGGAELAPIPRARLTTLGRPLRVGSLEWTPLEVHSGRAKLERTRPGRRRETIDGGPGSLLLRARVRNLSPDSTFAPLDRAFVRLPDRGPPDCLIEVEGDGTIDAYPLAVASELSIVGQSFDPLRPGQEREILIVSDKGATDRARGAMTWRLRLRTAPDQTETMGVEFHQGDIR
jgi:hypothetical protein